MSAIVALILAVVGIVAYIVYTLIRCQQIRRLDLPPTDKSRPLHRNTEPLDGVHIRDRNGETAPAWLNGISPQDGPCALLLRLVKRRCDLIGRGAGTEDGFVGMERDVTDWILMSEPAPAETTVERLRQILGEFHEVVTCWENSREAGRTIHTEQTTRLKELLYRCDVSWEAESPLLEYHFVTMSIDASLEDSLETVMRQIRDYRVASGNAEQTNPSSTGLLTFIKTLVSYAENMEKTLEDYESLDETPARLGRIENTSKHLQSIQVSLRDNDMPRFEAELCSALVTRARELLRDEFHAIRGQPQWVIRVKDSTKHLKLRHAEPVVMKLVLEDKTTARPRTLTVTTPKSSSSGTAAPYYRIDETRFEFKPYKTGESTFDLSIPVTVPEPPKVSFTLDIRIPLDIESEDRGFTDKEHMVFHDSFKCTVSRPKSNPYLAGREGSALAGDSHIFTGRKDIIEEILKHLGRDASSLMILWGLSRSGKTSVLNRVKARVKDRSVVVQTTAAAEGMVPGEYVTELRQRILDALPRAKIHLAEKAKSLATVPAKDPVSDFLRLLRRLEGPLEKANKAVVVMLDEYQDLRLTGVHDPVLRMLKAIFDLREYSRLLKFVAAGTFSLSQLDDENRQCWREVLGGRMTAKKLDAFTFEEATKLIIRYSREVGVSWPSPMVRKAMALTAGNPFLLNLLCFFVIEQVYAKEDGSLVVDDDTIWGALKAWLAQSGGGIDDLKFCYAEPSTWSTFETTVILHVLSNLAHNSGASCFEDMPSYSQTDVSDYLCHHYPYVPLADIDMNSAFNTLVERDILKVSESARERMYTVRFGILTYTLQRHRGRFERLLDERGYL